MAAPDFTPADRAPGRAGAWASQGGRLATTVVECVDLTDPEQAARLADGGTWFVVAEFEAFGPPGRAHAGRARAWRFADVRRAPSAVPAGEWRGPGADAWRSSMDREAYEAAVARVRDHVRAGDVYQVNVCRVLAAPLGAEPGAAGPVDAVEPDAAALADRLAAGNPAPHAAAIHVPRAAGVDPVWVVGASPELYLRVDAGSGTVSSGPIKGTARTAAGLTAKDRAENVMITDLVRNDLQRVCRSGTVAVTDLLAVEEHPGLVHLVSRVTGALRSGLRYAPDRWRRVLDATFPPGSVSGAPKSSALRIVDELEPVPRGPYCGAVGWLDADEGVAELSVGIRTFWWTDEANRTGGSGVLRFGTGAGITWGSDPTAEWAETELKAERLVGLASS